MNFLYIYQSVPVIPPVRLCVSRYLSFRPSRSVMCFSRYLSFRPSLGTQVCHSARLSVPVIPPVSRYLSFRPSLGTCHSARLSVPVIPPVSRYLSFRPSLGTCHSARLSVPVILPVGTCHRYLRPSLGTCHSARLSVPVIPPVSRYLSFRTCIGTCLRPFVVSRYLSFYARPSFCPSVCLSVYPYLCLFIRTCYFDRRSLCPFISASLSLRPYQ
ncbi:unnamed protein product [Acanthosepion pharaonis]|uniref:Uncharacterized protein n=1 Tax=Acanthosepion pharaonis TaxID=158019 RepID=A0A812CKC5_ACAPH|nr:unnamed protein product [Sepia pharaonis]